MAFLIHQILAQIRVLQVIMYRAQIAIIKEGTFVTVVSRATLFPLNQTLAIALFLVTLVQV
jgi:hypothetical protein